MSKLKLVAKKISFLLLVLSLTSCQKEKPSEPNTPIPSAIPSADKGSGSTEKEESYSLSSTREHGSLSFTVSGKSTDRAKEGETVTVLLSFDEGYEFDKITSSSSSVSFVEVEKGKKYSFVRPKENVLVEVTAKTRNKFEAESVLLLGNSISSFQGVKRGESFYLGTSVNCSFTGTADFTYEAEVNGKKRTLNKKENNYTFSFQVTSSFSLVVSQWKNPSASGIQFSYNGSSEYQIYGRENGGSYSKDDFSFYLIADKGYEVTGQYLIDGASGLDLSIGDDGLVALTNLPDGAKSVSLNLSSRVVGSGNIFFDPDEEAKLILEKGKTVNVLKGDFVSIKAKGREGYKPVSAKVTKKGTEDVVQSRFVPEEGLLTFTRPECDVFVSFEIAVPLSLSFTPNEAIKDRKFTVDGTETTKAFPTDTVYLEPTFNDGYKPSDTIFYYQEGKEVDRKTDALSDVRFSFTMPSTSVQITCVSSRYYKVSFTGTTDAYNVERQRTEYKENETVSFSLTANTGYEIVSVKLGETILSKDSSGNYNFPRPKGDAEISIETKTIATGTLVFKKDEGIETIVLTDGKKELQSGDNVNVGAKIEATISLKEGYQLKKEGGIVLTPASDSLTKVDEGKYTFTRPSPDMDGQVTLAVTSEPITYPKLTVNYDSNALVLTKVYDQTASKHYNKPSFPLSSIPSGHKVSVSVHVKDTAVYDYTTIKAVRTTSKGETTRKITEAYSEKYDSMFTFTRPDEDVSFSLSVEKKKVEPVKTYSLQVSTYKDDSIGSGKFGYNLDGSSSYSTEARTYKAGDTLYVKPNLTEEEIKVANDNYQKWVVVLRDKYGIKKQVSLADGTSVVQIKLDLSTDLSIGLTQVYYTDKDF